MADEFRLERDSLGEVQVPGDRLWGAQTERSRLNFTISGERMPAELVLALVEVKLGLKPALARAFTPLASRLA